MRFRCCIPNQPGIWRGGYSRASIIEVEVVQVFWWIRCDRGRETEGNDRPCVVWVEVEQTICLCANEIIR